MANACASSAPISRFPRARTPPIAENYRLLRRTAAADLSRARLKKSPSGFSVKPMRRRDRLATSYLVVPLHIHVMLPVLPVDDSNGYNFCRHDRLRETFSEIIVDRLYDVRGGSYLTTEGFHAIRKRTGVCGRRRQTGTGSTIYAAARKRKRRPRIQLRQRVSGHTASKCRCMSNPGFENARLGWLGWLGSPEACRQGISDSRHFYYGRGDVPSAVMAMKGGAIEFLTKPLDEDALMRAVDAALARAHVLRKEVKNAATLRALYQSLTPREQDLLP
jgi:hypothetical protein